MKTITNGVITKRVDDVTAQDNIKKGWKYCPKSSWKNALRANTVCTGQEPATVARVCEHGYKMACPHGCL